MMNLHYRATTTRCLLVAAPCSGFTRVLDGRRRFQAARQVCNARHTLTHARYQRRSTISADSSRSQGRAHVG